MPMKPASVLACLNAHTVYGPASGFVAELQGHEMSERIGGASLRVRKMD